MIVEYFRKGIIEKEINDREYIVRDLVDNTEKHLRISGKQLMWKKEIGIQKGDSVYIYNDKYKMRETWRMLTSTDFKMSQGWNKLKRDLDTFLKSDDKN